MKQPIPSHDADAGDPRQRLSELMDGHGDRRDVEIGVALWRDDAGARAEWHAWHLIGDVMRSDDLASGPARDEAFLARLRERLADEPPLLAPAPLASAPSVSEVAAVAVHRRRNLWLSSAAVAAGFVAVAGALVVARSPDPAAESGSTVLSSAGSLPSPGAGVQRVGAVPASSATLVLDGQMVRDAQLDAYLRAHRQMLVGAPAAVPGSAMRSVETIVPGR